MIHKIISTPMEVVASGDDLNNKDLTLVKHAQKTTSADLIAEVEKVQKSLKSTEIAALCFAVFPYEVFGENDNGDSVFENVFGEFIAESQTLPVATRTYTTKGNVFENHNSKDINNKIGKVHFAQYNHDQHRVELIISVDKTKAPHIYRKLKRKQQVLVSMGCGVDYDVCSVCCNIATKPSQHCDHVRYQLLDLVDGIPVHMINAGMTYFDISTVIINGDINARITYVANNTSE